jgi:hypothetical protein
VLAIAILAGALTAASAQPRIDVAAAAAFGGWSRPQRMTEVDVRVSAGVATQATLELAGRREKVRVPVHLEPGRPLRLHVPAHGGEAMTVTLLADGAVLARTDVSLARSESPLLVVGVEGDADAAFEGFHGVKVDADALPRNASAYASADALLLDGATLGALDERQATALATYAAGCGRLVLIGMDVPRRRALDAAAGCSGRTVMHAESVARARQLLRASLASALPEPMSTAGASGLLPDGSSTWQRVMVLVVAYFVAAAVALALATSQAVALAVAPVAALAALAALHFIEASPKLVVWSEADSGARIARYEAWQAFPGAVRGRTHAATVARLGSARPCNADAPVVLDFGADSGLVTGAAFDARLFRVALLCYSGVLASDRTIRLERRGDGALRVHNAGRVGVPGSLLVDDGRVRDVPALAAGASATLADAPGEAASRLPRAVLARARNVRTSMVWPLDETASAALPAGASGWLLLAIPAS